MMGRLLFVSVVLALRLALWKAVSNGRHVGRRALYRPLTNLVIEIGHKLQFTRPTSHSTITKACR